jgi:putative MFS transporter
MLELVDSNELSPRRNGAFAVSIGSSTTHVCAAGALLVPVYLHSIGIGNTMYAAAAVELLGLLVSVWLAPKPWA